MLEVDVLTAFTGIAVHDAWAPYDTYTDARHVLCGAIVLREPPGRHRHRRRHRPDRLVPGPAGHRQPPEDQTARDRAQGPPTGSHPIASWPTTRAGSTRRPPAAASTDVSKLADKHRALARRLRDRLPAHLAFATDPTIPFDNNAAERETRMAQNPAENIWLPTDPEPAWLLRRLVLR
jgi:transposase